MRSLRETGKSLAERARQENFICTSKCKRCRMFGRGVRGIDRKRQNVITVADATRQGIVGEARKDVTIVLLYGEGRQLGVQLSRKKNMAAMGYFKPISIGSWSKKTFWRCNRKGSQQGLWILTYLANKQLFHFLAMDNAKLPPARDRFRGIISRNRECERQKRGYGLCALNVDLASTTWGLVLPRSPQQHMYMMKPGWFFTLCDDHQHQIIITGSRGSIENHLLNNPKLQFYNH